MSFKNMMLFPGLLLLLLISLGCERKVVNEVNGDQTSFSSCFTCHGDQELALVRAREQWEKSKHASGAHTYENSSSCQRCHTSEGFIANVSGESYSGDEFSAIGCFTCHSPHTNGNLNLRVSTAAVLGNNNTYDLGDGNLCSACHVGRRNAATYVVANTELSNHYGPHHSNQTDMLVGDNAYEYTGYTPGYNNSYHISGLKDGCLDCHKAPSLFATGGHTFYLEDEEAENGLGYDNVEGCNVTACHSGNPLDSLNRVANGDFDWDGTTEGVQTEIAGLLDSLQGLLFDGDLLEWIQEENDSIPEPKEDRIVATADSAGAVFNYMFVKEDRSMGVHNTDYAVALLQSSINFMNAGNPNGVAVPGDKYAKTLMASH